MAKGNFTVYLPYSLREPVKYLNGCGNGVKALVNRTVIIKFQEVTAAPSAGGNLNNAPFIAKIAAKLFSSRIKFKESLSANNTPIKSALI